VPSLLIGEFGHDLTHLHCLTWSNFLNANNYLIIGGTRCALEQFPKAHHQATLVFR